MKLAKFQMYLNLAIAAYWSAALIWGNDSALWRAVEVAMLIWSLDALLRHGRPTRWA